MSLSVASQLLGQQPTVHVVQMHGHSDHNKKAIDSLVHRIISLVEHRPGALAHMLLYMCVNALRNNTWTALESALSIMDWRACHTFLLCSMCLVT